MLVTLVIGLREGLEAALIVAIIATFLNRARASLTPMWWGVAAAIAASLTVGVTLEVVAVSLDQAAQEGLETVIGVAAAGTVTAMVLWMSRHARSMKSDLERAAGVALSRGSTLALALMAFLAVLREGFESAVFLLATFQAATTPLLAGIGAVLGFAAAAAIGVGIYRGAVHIDLGRLFRVSAAFLVVVAAGLVLQTLRHAHEATWLNVGQQRVADLSWLAPAGSLRAALVTGVLGIPADPRLVEVVGWACYLVPTLALVLWPTRHRPSAATSVRLRWASAGVAAVAAIALPLVVPAAGRPAPSGAVATTAGGATVGTVGLVARDDGTADLVLTAPGGTTATTLGRGEAGDDADGLPAEHFEATARSTPSGAPATLSLEDLVALVGRVPVGVDPAQDPGPFDARWTVTATEQAWASDGTLLDATSTATTTVTVSGGGLTGSRTLRVDAAHAPADAAHASWTLPGGYRAGATAAVDAADHAARERSLWALLLPVALALAAVYQGVRALTATRRRTAAPPQPAEARRDAPVVAATG